jgi:hypothetical protein
MLELLEKISNHVPVWANSILVVIVYLLLKDKVKTMHAKIEEIVDAKEEILNFKVKVANDFVSKADCTDKREACFKARGEQK